MRNILNKNEVKQYMSEGHTLKEAAYNFKVKYNSMARFCREYGITKKSNKCPFTVEEMTKIAKNRTVNEICEYTGVDVNNIRNFLRVHNIEYKRVYMKADNKLLKDMIICLSKEFNAKSIIEQLHLPCSYVYNTIQEYRLEIHDREGK